MFAVRGPDGGGKRGAVLVQKSFNGDGFFLCGGGQRQGQGPADEPEAEFRHYLQFRLTPFWRGSMAAAMSIADGLSNYERG